MEINWLWYWGLRRYLGLWRETKLSIAKAKWKKLIPEPPGGYICALCYEKIEPHMVNNNNLRDRNPGKREFTLDHIIPIDYVYNNLTTLDLIFETVNLQPAHMMCNAKKGNKLPAWML